MTDRDEKLRARDARAGPGEWPGRLGPSAGAQSAGAQSAGRRSGEPPVISVVVPAHDEEENIRPLLEALVDVLQRVGLSWEIVLVDDGSRDRTWEEILLACRASPRVEGVKLSRNFGHQNAILAGLAAASGEAVICMDADLQHPPEVLPRLVEEWRRGAMVVSTVRTDATSTSFLKRATSWGFYRLLSFLCAEPIHAGMSDFGLLDRRVVTEILRLRESHLFLRGIVQWVGFPSSRVTYRASDRARGATKFGWSRMLAFAVTGITSMSIRPLRLSILGALLAAACGLCELAYAVYVSLVLGTAVPGWASTLVVVSFFFTLLFLYLGVFGEYLGKVFENVKSRPRYLVEARASDHLRRDAPPSPETASERAVELEGVGS